MELFKNAEKAKKTNPKMENIAFSLYLLDLAHTAWTVLVIADYINYLLRSNRYFACAWARGRLSAQTSIECY